MVTPVPEGASAPGAEVIPAPTALVAPESVAPTLDGSDDQIRGWAAELSSAEEWPRWLTGPDLARRLVATLWAVSQGESPRRFLALLAPRTRFDVVERGGHIYASPRSFDRFSGIAGVVQGLDVAKAAAGWRALEPFLARVHHEIAPAGRSLQQTLDDATALLLRVEVPEGDLEVIQKGAVYHYADPALEELTPAQKHLLRMGAANARVVQAKIRELRAALGLAAAP